MKWALARLGIRWLQARAAQGVAACRRAADAGRCLDVIWRGSRMAAPAARVRSPTPAVWGRRARPPMRRAATGGCRAPASHPSGANVGRRHLLRGMLASPRDDLPHRFETKPVLTEVAPAVDLAKHRARLPPQHLQPNAQGRERTGAGVRIARHNDQPLLPFSLRVDG